MKAALDILALITVMVWPVVPLFWIPVHGLPGTFKRLGLLTYVVPAVLWCPVALAVFLNRQWVLSFRADLPPPALAGGALLLCLGTALHIWTGRLLGLWGLMGLPEVSDKVESRLTDSGPFSVVRHPTYLAHTLMFTGIFLMTGSLAVGMVTLLDFIAVNAVIIPLEEKELMERFGDEYREYRKKVPRIFPSLTRESRSS
jgi:protein-S-isoprenylcysteine O-methyltransferase Ste14